MTARELFSFRRNLILMIGRRRANHRTRELIKDARAPHVDPPSLVQHLQRALPVKCAGSYLHGAWSCTYCGADGESDCLLKN